MSTPQISLAGHAEPHGKSAVSPARRREIIQRATAFFASRGIVAPPKPQVISIKRADLSRFRK